MFPPTDTIKNVPQTSIPSTRPSSFWETYQYKTNID